MEKRLLPSAKYVVDGRDYLVDLARLQIGDWFARGAYSMIHHGMYNDQSVAVKIITTTGDRQLKARLEKQFNREVTLLSRLHHRNVIKLVGACRKQPFFYILTEYLSNGSLRQYMHKTKNKPLPLKKVIDIGLDIARGMKYTHSQGIIHMDLKPENILIDEDFSIKIADFGIACPTGNCDTYGDQVAGTYRWMAPEILQKKSYGRKVDVYSFGLILWEMISGKIPFHNLEAYQAAYAAAHKNVRPQIDQSCPDVMRAIIERCWSSEVEKRPEFSELVQVLKECQASAAIDGTLSSVQDYVIKYGEGSSNGLLLCLRNICPSQI